MEKIDSRAIRHLEDVQRQINERIECIAQTNGLTNGNLF